MGWYVYIIGQAIKPNSRRGLANRRELPVAAKGQVNSSAKCKTPWHAAGRAKAKKGTIKKRKYHDYVYSYSKGIFRGMMGRLPIPLPTPYRHPTDTLAFDLQPIGPKHLKPLCALAFTRNIYDSCFLWLPTICNPCAPLRFHQANASYLPWLGACRSNSEIQVCPAIPAKKRVNVHSEFLK